MSTNTNTAPLTSFVIITIDNERGVVHSTPFWEYEGDVADAIATATVAHINAIGHGEVTTTVRDLA